MAEDQKLNTVVYSGDDGLVFISNAVRIRIMDELENGDISMSDLCRALDRPQSTVSAAVNDLISEHVLTMYADENDGSKRKIGLASRRQFVIDRPMPSVAPSIDSTLLGVITGDTDFYYGILVTVFTCFKGMGLNILPFAGNVGTMFGNFMSDRMKSMKMEDIIGEISAFYEKNGIGKMTVVTFVPLTLTVEKSFNTTEGASELFSEFTQNLFKSIFMKRLNKEFVTRPFVPEGLVKGSYGFTVESKDSLKQM